MEDSIHWKGTINRMSRCCYNCLNMKAIDVDCGYCTFEVPRQIIKRIRRRTILWIITIGYDVEYETSYPVVPKNLKGCSRFRNINDGYFRGSGQQDRRGEDGDNSREERYGKK